MVQEDGVLKKIYIKISKFLSFILRHGPKKVGLDLDSKGFADLNEILKVLNKRFQYFKITKSILEEIIDQSEKKRFQIENSKIRAFYGHSLKNKIESIHGKYWLLAMYDQFSQDFIGNQIWFSEYELLANWMLHQDNSIKTLEQSIIRINDGHRNFNCVGF